MMENMLRLYRQALMATSIEHQEMERTTKEIQGHAFYTFSDYTLLSVKGQEVYGLVVCVLHLGINCLAVLTLFCSRAQTSEGNFVALKKCSIKNSDIVHEVQIFRHLPTHPNIVKFYVLDKDFFVPTAYLYQGT